MDKAVVLFNAGRAAVNWVGFGNMMFFGATAGALGI